MANVNVNRNLTDQFYRYKMPKLIAKVEGKGNGIKTVIVNMVEIAKALNRPPTYPTKYFGCVLGAQVNWDLKNDRFIVNGSHEASKLQDLLDGFIQKYVLCPSCENPETILSVNQKKAIIGTTCQACGYSGVINTQDKLATYILKCPPHQTTSTGASVQPGKKSKRKKKEEKTKKHHNGDSNDNQQDSDEFNEQDNGELNGDGNEDNHDDDDWCVDTDADAVAKRMEELSVGAKGLMLNDDLEKSQDERLQMLFDFVKKKKNGTKDGPLDVNLQKEIVAEAERLDVRDKAVLVLCEILFDDPAKIIQQIKNYRLLFLRFTTDNTKAQKYLLRGFEFTIKEYKNQLISRVPHILKAFYDSDIIEEKVLIEWGSKVQKRNVGKELAQEIFEKAAPFIKWLKEAEEEESSDDDEEEIEVVYDDRIRPDKVIQVEETTVSPAQPAKPANNQADEIDIDAI